MPRPFWRRHLRRLIKHACWATLAVSGLYACRALLPAAVLKGTNDVGGSFLQTFGGMYGIIVAFAMFVVWQQHNETQLAIEREAVSLGELHRLLGWFTSWPLRDDVRSGLRDYALAVPEHLGEKPHAARSDDRAILDRGLNAFLDYTPAPGEERFYEAALELFHELNEAREHRITVARLRLPEGLRWFVFLGGGVTVAALWLLWVESPVVHALLTAGMTWVVVAAASIVIDLDQPYTGDFVVDWGRFTEAAKQMEAVSCPPSRCVPPEPPLPLGRGPG